MRLLRIAFIAAGLIVAMNLGMMLERGLRPVEASTLAKDPYITLMGWATSPSCPSGWTEVVADTSAGTIAPETGWSQGSMACDPAGCLGSGGYGGSPNSPTTTTYTWKYRVCRKN